MSAIIQYLCLVFLIFLSSCVHSPLQQSNWGEPEWKTKITAATVTELETTSVSKWLTATAAMILADQGKLDLDSPIQNYCPRFPVKPWTITAPHLLTHTSGIRHYADYDTELAEATNNQQRERIERKRSRDLLGRFTRYTDVITPLDNFKHDPLVFEPGNSWKYSSHGYRVLICVMQGAVSKPYNTIMRELILNPSGMTNTVADDAWAIIANRASKYRLIQGQALRRADIRDISENLPPHGETLYLHNKIMVMAPCSFPIKTVPGWAIPAVRQEHHPSLF